jgi:uncharacterized membrane protein (UPF0182 family)
MAVGFVVVVGRLATTALVEILWHAEVGYGAIFWKRVIWEWGVRFGAGAAAALLVFFNLRVVAKTLGGIQIKRRFGNLEISEQLPKSFVFWGMAGISTLLGSWFGAAVPRSVGLQALLYMNSESWGATVPVLDMDVGFFVFALPVLGSAVTFALVAVFLVFTLSTAGYAATGALQWGPGKFSAQQGTRTHLGGLLAVFLVLLGLRLWVGRYLLFLDGTSGVQGIFGYTDANARLPGLQTLSIICFLGAGGVFWGAWKNRVAPLLASAVTVVVASIVIGQAYPSLVQRFQVEPNELVRETPFIEANIEFTRAGFGLDQMERRRFPYNPEEAVDWSGVAEQFSGLPVWGEGALLTTYREIEARFPYYDFATATIDRYQTPNGPVPVALSVREVDPSGIGDPNWQNLYIRERYIGGMGVVASLATTRTPEGRPSMAVSGIPPEFSPESELDPALWELTRPQVYFGARAQLWAVINPSAEQFLDPSGAPGVDGVDFPTGIGIGGFFRKAALAWRFRDANLLFASEITAESRFVYRRRVLERVRAIAPFLRLPEAPYPVVAGGRVVWVLEGFSGTRAFPLSATNELGFGRRVSYARNSVKIVVDGVSGRVDFYRVPMPDPLLDAYAQAFPGLLKPMSEMPQAIRDHIRYPKALLNLQAQVLLQYHQDDAPVFHGQTDVWALSQELEKGTSPVPYRPEYGIFALPGEEAQFNLTTVFVPAGRQNLTGILAGRLDEEGLPDLVLFDVPVEDQAPGPRQVEALVEQDPIISQEFSLWRTGGSDVWTGHLHLVPVGGRILYMEPVFLAAEADAIPELRRFVVSDGRRVAMTEDLAGAISALAGMEVSMPSVGSEGQVTLPAVDIPVGEWPAAALDLLDEAETRLRAGDWQGFGVALEELRTLLRQLEQGGN